MLDWGLGYLWSVPEKQKWVFDFFFFNELDNICCTISALIPQNKRHIVSGRQMGEDPELFIQTEHKTIDFSQSNVRVQRVQDGIKTSPVSQEIPSIRVHPASHFTVTDQCQSSKQSLPLFGAVKSHIWSRQCRRTVGIRWKTSSQQRMKPYFRHFHSVSQNQQWLLFNIIYI